jgi:hypothetical protein
MAGFAELARAEEGTIVDARKVRIVAVAGLMAGTLLPTWAGPAAAADCTLSAPSYVNVGTPITIQGAGFPASTSVDIAFSLDGTASDSFTVQSTDAGALQLALTPEDIDVGVTTVRATAGTACSAQVTYTVLAAGATPPPSATAAPEATSGTGAAPTAPRTDAAKVAGGGGWSGSAVWLALVLVAVGGGGLFSTRSARRR